MTSTTTVACRDLETVPKSIDLYKPSSSSPSTSDQGVIMHFSPKQVPPRSLHMSTPIPRTAANLNKYLALKYYQYEVTYGLYVMTLGEKLVVNSIVVGLLSLVL